MSDLNIDAEKKLVEEKIFDSLKWPFPEKKIERLLGAIAQDERLFIYHPDSQSTIKGFDSFKPMLDVFQSDDVQPTSTDISELRISLSQSGEVAWFSALCEDHGFYKEKAYHWSGCRWTGVLEKRNGDWKIVQMHFSLPTDQKQE